MNLSNFKDSIAYCEAKGLSLCFKAYADHTAGEEIMDIGFNPNSGYVYIAMENGIQIASMLGREVEYIVFTDDDEKFFDSYEEAYEQLYK